MNQTRRIPRKLSRKIDKIQPYPYTVDLEEYATKHGLTSNACNAVYTLNDDKFNPSILRDAQNSRGDNKFYPDYKGYKTAGFKVDAIDAMVKESLPWDNLPSFDVKPNHNKTRKTQYNLNRKNAGSMLCNERN